MEGDLAEETARTQSSEGSTSAVSRDSRGSQHLLGSSHRMRYNGKTDSSTISARVRELGFERYADYLASPHWQEVRRRFYAKHPRRCGCGAFAVALHHKTYERLGAERLEDLEAVCDKCHRERHGRRTSPRPRKAEAPPKPKPKPKPRRRRRRKKKVAPVEQPVFGLGGKGRGYRRGEAKNGPSRLTFHP